VKTPQSHLRHANDVVNTSWSNKQAQPRKLPIILPRDVLGKYIRPIITIHNNTAVGFRFILEITAQVLAIQTLPSNESGETIIEKALPADMLRWPIQESRSTQSVFLVC